MKSSVGLILGLLVVVQLFGCGKNDSDRHTVSTQNSAPQAPSIVFESERELSLALGMLGDGDALLKKKLGTSVGSTIEIKNMYVWSYDGSDWERGGKLHLMNDYSMGRAYRVMCSISSNSGDKFMETKNRREIKITGIIASYSSSSGLTIDPCNATW